MNYLEQALDLLSWTTALRRHFHTYPECQPAEQLNTMRYIEEQLDQLQIRHVRVEKGGILGFIDGGRPGKTLLLRTDIDALPVSESPVNLAGTRTCISSVPNVMHACGHDAHMAMLLTEARLLKECAAELPGRVILMFQEGEEGGGNIRYLLEYFSAQHLQIDAAYACHVRWDLDSGLVGIPAATSMCGLGHFIIRIHGKKAHGSRPDEGANVIDCFTRLHSTMQSIRMTCIPPDSCLTFSVCTISAGTVHNILPDELEAQGTVRFADEAHGQLFIQKLRTMAAACGEMTGCTAQVIIAEHHFPVKNDPVCLELFSRAAVQAVGSAHAVPHSTWMASESFSHISSMIPSVFAFVGIRNRELGSGAGHHTELFDVDESSLPYGVAAAVSYAVAYLNTAPDTSHFSPAAPDWETYLKQLY